MAKARSLTVDHRRDRSRWRAPAGLAPSRPRSAGSPASALAPVPTIGPNPGGLQMLAHAPANLPANAPLVVVLHGCSQDAKGYDAASGWSRLADEYGFAVLFPEQRQSNNPGGCFNWFLPADAARGLGEARSIHDMIEHMVHERGLDRGRIFVTGLSAGGAMTSALLANYPELFSAGAVIAGLPCGAATSVHEALRVMANPTEKPADELGDLVRTASPHTGRWPRLMVIHGTRDATVAPKNADELVKQWLDVHGAPTVRIEETAADGVSRRVWRREGVAIVEQLTIESMGHGAPLDGRLGETKAPFMLDVGLSSTREIAAFFGLGDAAVGTPAPRRAGRPNSASSPRILSSAPDTAATERPASGLSNLGARLREALKALGLFR